MMDCGWEEWGGPDQGCESQIYGKDAKCDKEARGQGGTQSKRARGVVGGEVGVSVCLQYTHVPLLHACGGDGCVAAHTVDREGRRSLTSDTGPRCERRTCAALRPGGDLTTTKLETAFRASVRGQGPRPSIEVSLFALQPDHGGIAHPHSAIDVHTSHTLVGS